MMTIDGMIEVLQAAKAGKEIEFCTARGGEWSKNSHPSWNFLEYNYRAKPEPKLRLLTVKELPPFIQIKHKNKDRWLTVTATDLESKRLCFYFGNEWGFGVAENEVLDWVWRGVDGVEKSFWAEESK